MLTNQTLDIEILEQRTVQLAVNGMFWLDETGHIRHANDAACQILDYPYRELIKKTIFEIDPNTSTENFENEYLKVIRKKGRHSFDTQKICRNGKVIDSEVTVFHIEHEGMDLYCAFFFDITEKKQQDYELRKTKYAIEHNANSFLWIKSDGQISYVNNATCRCLGFTKDELYSKTVMDIFPGCTVEIWSDFWEKLNRQKYQSIEGKLQRNSGDSIPVEIHADHFEIDGQNQCFVCFRDLTEKHKYKSEQKKFKKQQVQSQKLESLGTLAAGIAHDFNNILSGIFGYSQLAEIDIHNPEKIKNHISKIRSGAQRASELVQQILTFSRQTEYLKEPLLMYPVVKETLELLRSSFPANIVIHGRIDSKIKVMADPTRIHQVLMNLCTNACHAMKETGGKLTVKLQETNLSNSQRTGKLDTPPGNYLKLSVKDTGCGMDAALLEKAFEPYFTTKQLGEGTGLGLALVQAIVAEHNAHLEVDTAPGKGTEISIYFPIIDFVEAPEKTENTGRIIFNGKETIMVVEDEVSLREIYKDLLEGYGYKVCLYENGREAFYAYQQNAHQYDLVITDMDMPGMTGSELANRINLSRKNVPIILSSGFDYGFCEENGGLNGVHAFLMKPFPELRLLKMVRELLDKKQESRLARIFHENSKETV